MIVKVLSAKYDDEPLIERIVMRIGSRIVDSFKPSPGLNAVIGATGLEKRLNELILLKREIFRQEAEILPKCASTGAKRLLGLMRSRLMRRGP